MKDNVGEIYKKIPLIMGEIGAIGKTKENKMQHYKFRGIDDVYLAVQGVLSKHGVFTSPEILSMEREERKTKAGGVLIYTILMVKYTFYAEDGSSIESVMVGEAMDSGDKSCNKAMSAAQKYAFLQIFSIPTEEPKDTENESPQPQPRGAMTAKEKQMMQFLKAMDIQWERVGDGAFNKVLGGAGYEKAKDITKKVDQTSVFKALCDLPDKERK